MRAKLPPIRGGFRPRADGVPHERESRILGRKREGGAFACGAHVIIRSRRVRPGAPGELEGTGNMAKKGKARAVGINHVALEVGDIDEALEFYGGFLEFELRGRSENMAFIDLGDLFINFSRGRRQPEDDDRHFGLVVDDKEAVRSALAARGVEVLPGRFLDFRDPWGNRVEIVGYENIQFSKTPGVLRGMGLADLSKNDNARGELSAKGMTD